MIQTKPLKNLLLLFVSLISFSVSYSQPCFLPVVEYNNNAMLYQPKKIITADFNNDGKLDIASANNAVSYGVSILRGTGTGSFTALATWFPMGYRPESIVSGDFNNDGNQDIVAVGSPTTNTHAISFLNGIGTGSFSPAVTYTLAADASVVGWDLNKGDYNGDGKLDVSYVKLGPSVTTSSVTCMLGNGLGAFPAITTYTLPGNITKMCTGDFNLDGKSDLALPNNNTLFVKFGASSAPLSSTTTYTLSGAAASIETADFNGDSNLDIAYANSSVFRILLGSSSGTFSPAVPYSMGLSAESFKAADFNNDGYDDLFSATPAGTRALFGNASGNMTLGVNSYTYPSVSGGGVQAIATGDFTSDGKQDVVLTYYSGSTTFLSIFKSGLQTFTVNSGTICSGKNFTITPSGALSYTFSSGTNTVSPLATSVYTVIASFAQGCNNTNTSTVNVIPSPTIALSNATICLGDSYTISPTGANTYTYSSGNVVSPSALTVYTVSGTSVNGCVSSNTISVNVLPVQTPTICLVTLDSLANNNEIYWEKSLYTNVDSFIVYREVSTNIYKRIGAISVNAFSMYTDTNRSIGPANGNPNLTAYRYKLQIRNTCGNYGALSLWHETIFVQDQLNGNFNWNAYAIESSGTPVANYNLKRVNITNGQETLVGSTTNNIFTDPQYASLASSGNIKWFVDATGFNCNPTAKVAAQKIKTKSNHANDLIITKTIELNFQDEIKVYPNPVKDKLTIETGRLNDNVTIELNNLLGQSLIKINTSEKIYTINTATYPSGIYFLNIKSNNKIVSVKKVVID